MTRDEYQFKKENWDGHEVSWPQLESFSDKGCQCGNPECETKTFTVDNPMELAVNCHKGAPLIVSYWDGWLYCRCSYCHKPSVKIPVSKSLL